MNGQFERPRIKTGLPCPKCNKPISFWRILWHGYFLGYWLTVYRCPSCKAKLRLKRQNKKTLKVLGFILIVISLFFIAFRIISEYRETSVDWILAIVILVLFPIAELYLLNKGCIYLEDSEKP